MAENLLCFEVSVYAFMYSYKLLRALERYSISTNFYSLSEANTVGARVIILLLPVLIGILTFSAPFLSSVSVRLHIFTVHASSGPSPVTHTSLTYQGSRES
jgi:hypothetical protein